MAQADFGTQVIEQAGRFELGIRKYATGGKKLSPSPNAALFRPWKSSLASLVSIRGFIGSLMQRAEVRGWVCRFAWREGLEDDVKVNSLRRIESEGSMGLIDVIQQANNPKYYAKPQIKKPGPQTQSTDVD